MDKYEMHLLILDLLAACKKAIVAFVLHDKFGDDISARHAAEEDAVVHLFSAITNAEDRPERPWEAE